MAIAWNKGYDLDLICKHLKQSIIPSNRDSISFNYQLYLPIILIIKSAIVFDKSISESEKDAIIDSAILSTAKHGNITPKKLHSSLAYQELKYLSLEKKKYILITSISIDKNIKIQSQRIKNCFISFHDRIEPCFESARSEIIRAAKSSICGTIPNNYTIAKIYTNGKTELNAFNNAFNAITLYRAKLNFYYNRTIISRESLNKRDPVNSIVLGPLHTLHLPSSSLASESWWYDPLYSKQLLPVNIKKDSRLINDFNNNYKKLLKNNMLRHIVEDALCEYTEALDYIDWDKSFVKLWGILEFLTGTKPSDGYIDTINRASFLYTDREYAKLVLLHLKDYRNKSIHSRHSRNDVESLIYQLKSYVERIIEFYIVNRYHFNNCAEVAQFLSQPDDKKLLKKRINLMKNVINYIDS